MRLAPRPDSESRESRPHPSARTRANRRNAGFAVQSTSFPDEALPDCAARRPTLARVPAPVAELYPIRRAFEARLVRHPPVPATVSIDSPSRDGNNLLLPPFFCYYPISEEIHETQPFARF